MKKHVSAIVLGVVCFALGAAVQRFYDLRRPAGPPQTAQVKPLPETGAPVPEYAGPVTVAHDLSGEPLWAYGFDKPAAPGEKALPQEPPVKPTLRTDQDPVEQTKPRHVEGSRMAFSLLEIRDTQNVIDWFPEEHALPMPDVVKHGPRRAGDRGRGCAACHLANGKGRPENAQPGGLPYEYAMRQINDFRTGLRHTADPRKINTSTMIEYARAMTDDEMKAALEYFSSMKWTTPWVRVVETNLIPKTRLAGEMFHPTAKERTEPIAGRVVEVAEDEDQSGGLRNSHSGFVAYVPVGSINKGRNLVTTGGMKIVGDQIVQGKTTACGTCHGVDLMGVGDVPPIAGRSPSYLARQLFDIQQGTRNGASAQLMKLVVANLTKEDMVNIVAYVSSRPIPGAAAPVKQLAAAQN